MKAILNSKKVSTTIKAIKILFCFLIIFSLLSLAFFNTLNPFSSGVGFIRIVATDVDYVEIQHSPKIILAKSDNAYNIFLNYIQEGGYKIIGVEQMGSMHVIEKNGEKELVGFEGNGFYSKWVWQN